ncbi:leucyl aminopeptidase [Gemmobacter nectariphilus]|uniref:leucyl aminopeptidase n=1 Tax=Gemmobacter nectariphilus TaxID=220343 RepID=UPI000401AC0E|nr:leucyl aminopeptidase [Gemmobacter nectariphilus]
MTSPVAIQFLPLDTASLATQTGRLVLLTAGQGKGAVTRALSRLTKGAVDRALASPAFDKLKPGEALDLAWPAGLAAEALQIVKLDPRADTATARKAGATIGARLGEADTLVLAAGINRAAEVAFGLALRAYRFSDRKSEAAKPFGAVRMMVSDPEAVAAKAGPMAAVAEGVFFTRDLVSEPSNILNTFDFAARLAAMQELGLDVEILEEEDLEKLGMRTLLAVGMGSESPSKVVVMRWNGGGDEAPLALVGKGVCFDSGGISLKPAAGMEDMTMDMGGAAVVAGVMRTLALRKAKSNVVGLVGLVENMPSGRAQRPGDVVTSMKGDTIQVTNTDAEGRLVLADVLWYAQERFKPSGIIDLATLTGAVIIALGHENTGVFSNDDAFCDEFLKAARHESEGAWRLPLGEAYDAKLKSDIADIRNSTGARDAGSIVAACFLQRFVRPDMPWIHLDIAGTALTKADTAFAPKGATGWGVRAINHLIAAREG